MVSIPNGPSDEDRGQHSVEPGVLLDGSHGIDRTLEVGEKV